MQRWRGAVSALVASGLAVAVVQLAWPRPDFPPFVMTIEHWSSARIGLADGRTLAGTYVHRLEYERRDHWTLTLVRDEIAGNDLGPPREKPIACRNGAYGRVEPSGAFTETSRDPGFCNGVGRWIHYGIAWRYPWKKEVNDGLITYTDPGERIVFDARTGLPVIYEAGLAHGGAGERTVFRLERWLRS